MIVLYTGFNLYGQIPDMPSKQKITEFSSVSTDRHFEMSYSFNVLKQHNLTDKITIQGFVSNKTKHKIEISIPDIDTISQITCCDNLILFLRNDGTVLKLNVEDQVLQPTAVPRFISTDSDTDSSHRGTDTIVKLCSGRCMNLALSNEGDVFSIPTQIDTEKVKMVDIACGREHMVLLSVDGNVYTWGGGSRGQLGHESLEDVSEPRVVEALAGIKIVKISAGFWHTAVVSASGDLYTWGWNSNGQLGFRNENIENSYTKSMGDATKQEQQMRTSVSVLTIPWAVDFGDLNVLQVKCGARHTIVLTDDGSIYGSGWNKWGQLGMADETFENVDKMIKIHQVDKTNIDNIEVKTGPWSTAICIK